MLGISASHTALVHFDKPFKAQNVPFFYGWVIVFCGCFGMLMSIPGQTIGVSVFIDPLLEALQLSRSQLSTTYMIGTIVSAFCLPFAGRMYDQFGARAMSFIVALLLAMTLGSMSFIDHILDGLAESFSMEKTLESSSSVMSPAPGIQPSLAMALTTASGKKPCSRISHL